MDIPFVDGGRSFDGADCWGLCMLVSQHSFGVELPDEPGRALKSGEIDFVIAARTITRRLVEFRPVDSPREGDLVLLKPRQLPIHIGIVIKERPIMILHTSRGIGPACEKLYGRMWRDRIEGLYRPSGTEDRRVS